VAVAVVILIVSGDFSMIYEEKKTRLHEIARRFRLNPDDPATPLSLLIVYLTSAMFISGEFTSADAQFVRSTCISLLDNGGRLCDG
jgi:hypothetical protein